MKNINVINIDGVNGLGSSTQVNILARKLRLEGHTVLVNRIEGNLESNLVAADATVDFLKKNPNGIVINDGSIAKPIQLDIQNGMGFDNLYEKYRNILFTYEAIQHKYGLVNILLITDNMELCNERVIKKKALAGDSTSVGVEDIEREINLVKGFKIFDNYTIKKSLKFQILMIDGDESILEVNKDIMKIITEKFTIKNPSFEG